MTLGPAHSKVSTADTFFSEEKRDPRESATVPHENFMELDEDDTVTDGECQGGYIRSECPLMKLAARRSE